MKNFRFSKKTPRLLYSGFILLCVLAQNSDPAQIARAASVASDCFPIYNGETNGWVLEMCLSDPNNTDLMEVVVDGVSQGSAVQVRIYHKAQNFAGIPQVAVIDSHGFVRLKQNADPSPAIPFGTSFILGPAYWTLSHYYHNPLLTRFEFDTNGLTAPNGSLRMLAQGTNHDFAVSYDMTLPPPRDRQTRIHVNQAYMATADITIDQSRSVNHEGFKLVQASSMFINATDCVGYTDCHDSNAARYIGNDLIRHQVTFTGPITFFFDTSPQPLGSTWIDVLHTDDISWQGNTPNERIALDSLPTDRTITPQGNIDTGQTDPNDGDNVNLWLHDDGPASESWLAGDSKNIGYWLLAQDNPPDPWGDLGLRSGLTFLDFEGEYRCSAGKDANQPATSARIAPIAGYRDTALQLDYDLGANNYNWVQIRCDFNPPLNLSAYDHLRFDWLGSPSSDPAAANSLQVGMVDAQDHSHFDWLTYRHVAHHSWWDQLVIPFSFFRPSDDGTPFDPAHVKAIFFSVVKIPRNNSNDIDDSGGGGGLVVDNLNAYNAGSRTIPNTFDTVDPNKLAAQAAAGWLAKQQQSNGLLRSWAEEEKPPDFRCLAHTYDQALALIVFSDQGMWAQADKLVDKLVAIQNSDGSWYQTRTCAGAVENPALWEGDIAWTVYALSRYLKLGGTHTRAATAVQKGAGWLSKWIFSGRLPG
ncbi:MAG TPA: carbohydrate binding domain-containing protein [Anaerolineales bacterium]|nr:carbohydrate binding domain-containing protein [Anaerolineales bacterium]